MGASFVLEVPTYLMHLPSHLLPKHQHTSSMTDAEPLPAF